MRDSDGTVIFSLAPALTGGSKKTAAFAIKHKKPWLHIYRDGQYDAAELLLRFISDHKIKILNVAGPRASKEPADRCLRKESVGRGIFPATRFMAWRAGRGIVSMRAAVSHALSLNLALRPCVRYPPPGIVSCKSRRPKRNRKL